VQAELLGEKGVCQWVEEMLVLALCKIYFSIYVEEMQVLALFCSLICVCWLFYLAGTWKKMLPMSSFDHVPELLLLATCSSRLVVGLAGSGFN
jgi:hypothetical protein